VRTERKKKTRIIVRPWTPRKIPYVVSKQRVNEVISEARPKIKAILYVGWVRRKVDNKRKILFLAATGATASEARTAFKKSEDFGENIWLIE
jgi:hypothetical protein